MLHVKTYYSLNPYEVLYFLLHDVPIILILKRLSLGILRGRVFALHESILISLEKMKIFMKIFLRGISKIFVKTRELLQGFQEIAIV